MKVVVSLVLLAFLPLILFFAGGAYGTVVDAVFATSCMKHSAASTLCSPLHLLTFGGFMPAFMVVTVPCSVLIGIVLLVRRALKSRSTSQPAPQKPTR